MNFKIKIQKTKSIIFGILVGIIAFPTITLGGTFVFSLIQGKTVEEAVQILAKQIDSLIGRVEVLEEEQKTIQTQLEEAEEEKQIMKTQLEKTKACNDYNRILAEIKNTCGTFPYPGINACIWHHEYIYFVYSDQTLVMKRVNEGNRTEAYWHEEAEKEIKRINKLKELRTQYLEAAEGCGISMEEENQNSEKWINDRACHDVRKFESDNTFEELQSNPEYLWLKEYCAE